MILSEDANLKIVFICLFFVFEQKVCDWKMFLFLLKVETDNCDDYETLISGKLEIKKGKETFLCSFLRIDISFIMYPSLERLEQRRANEITSSSFQLLDRIRIIVAC